jgi:disulfide bond formation protein DsbB
MNALLQIINAMTRSDRWPITAFAASGALLLGAYAFEIFGNYPPCPLCIEQRWHHIYILFAGIGGFLLIIAIRALGPKAARDAADAMQPIIAGSRLKRFWLALRAPAGGARMACLILAGLFAWSTWTAGFHVGVEYGWWVYDCQVVDTSRIQIDDVLNALSTAQNVVPCDEAAWRMFGLTMAGYNTLFSAGLAVVSVVAAVRAPSWRPNL